LARQRQALSVGESQLELARPHVFRPRIPRCLESNPFRVNATLHNGRRRAGGGR
jgi:hypothetical protein